MSFPKCQDVSTIHCQPNGQKNTTAAHTCGKHYRPSAVFSVDWPTTDDFPAAHLRGEGCDEQRHQPVGGLIAHSMCTVHWIETCLEVHDWMKFLKLMLPTENSK